MRNITAMAVLLAIVPAANICAQTTGESSIFDGHMADALWTVIAFVVLLVVLGKLAWKPLLVNLKMREDHITGQISQAEAAREQAEALLNDHKKKGLELYQQIVDRAQRAQRDMLDQALEDVSQLRQKSQADVEMQKESAATELWNQAGDMVRLVTAEVLARTVTSKDDDRLIDEAIHMIREAQATK